MAKVLLYVHTMMECSFLTVSNLPMISWLLGGFSNKWYLKNGHTGL